MSVQETIDYPTGIADGLGDDLSHGGPLVSSTVWRVDLRGIILQEQKDAVAGDLVSDHSLDDARVKAISHRYRPIHQTTRAKC